MKERRKDKVIIVVLEYKLPEQCPPKPREYLQKCDKNSLRFLKEKITIDDDQLQQIKSL